MPLSAAAVMNQNDGEVTRAYYEHLKSLGPLGQVACALFRAQKRSVRAKDYRGGKYRRAAYDVKQWSMDLVCEHLKEHGEKLGIRYGWRQDPNTIFGDAPSWVLYVDLPQGQVSFHSPTRGPGPDYPCDWCGLHDSDAKIIAFCDEVVNGAR